MTHSVFVPLLPPHSTTLRCPRCYCQGADTLFTNVLGLPLLLLPGC